MSQIVPIKLQPILKKYIWGKEEWMLSDLHEEVESSPLLIKIITAEDHLSIQVTGHHTNIICTILSVIIRTHLKSCYFGQCIGFIGFLQIIT